MIRVMTIDDYDGVYNLWINTKGMGLNDNYRGKGIGTRLVDYTLSALKKEGINKVALVAFHRNEIGNSFWEKRGFTVREDLAYRNKALVELKRMDT